MTAQRAMSAGLPAPSAGRPAGRLADKVALVTGASRGIGRGIAEALAGAGARVVATSRSRSALDSVVDAITAAGGEAAALPCDVGDRDQVYGVVQDAAAAWGRLDILVNSAQGFGSAARPAASPVLHPLQDLDEEEWDYTYRTGPTATMWAMKASFEYLRRSGGTIINFASGQGLRGSEGSASYNCAKEAVRALSRTAAREWGRHGITVNVSAHWSRQTPPSPTLRSAQGRRNWCSRSCRCAGWASRRTSASSQCSSPARVPSSSPG
jgi:NAD(P)-dependent dehydrogenase (short-subunit alcohol dehydrogenase family)